VRLALHLGRLRWGVLQRRDLTGPARGSGQPLDQPVHLELGVERPSVEVVDEALQGFYLVFSAWNSSSVTTGANLS
jgi:hypothetical protein